MKSLTVCFCQFILAMISLARFRNRAEAAEERWKQVLTLLRMDENFQPAVACVLHEGRWRTKDDPKAYVGKAAYNAALRMQLLDYTGVRTVSFFIYLW